MPVFGRLEGARFSCGRCSGGFGSGFHRLSYGIRQERCFQHIVFGYPPDEGHRLADVVGDIFQNRLHFASGQRRSSTLPDARRVLSFHAPDRKHLTIAG